MALVASKRAFLIFSNATFTSSFHYNAVNLALADVVNSLWRGSRVFAQLLNEFIRPMIWMSFLRIGDNGKSWIAFTFSSKCSIPSPLTWCPRNSKVVMPITHLLGLTPYYLKHSETIRECWMCSLVELLVTKTLMKCSPLRTWSITCWKFELHSEVQRAFWRIQIDQIEW